MLQGIQAIATFMVPAALYIVMYIFLVWEVFATRRSTSVCYSNQRVLNSLLLSVLTNKAHALSYLPTL